MVDMTGFLKEMRKQLKSSDVNDIIFLLKSGSENRLLELELIETVEDLKTFLEQEKFLKCKSDIKSFMEILESIGRDDLAKMLEPTPNSQGIVHILRFHGFEMLAHIKNADEVIKTIDRLREDTSDSKVKVVLSTYKSEIIRLSEFKEVRCREYFKMYFKKLVHEDPIVLPNAIPSEIEKVVETMNSWCKNTNETSNLRSQNTFFLEIEKYGVFYIKLWKNNI